MITTTLALASVVTSLTAISAAATVVAYNTYENNKSLTFTNERYMRLNKWFNDNRAQIPRLYEIVSKYEINKFSVMDLDYICVTLCVDERVPKCERETLAKAVNWEIE